jgi:hypothetical protein
MLKLNVARAADVKQLCLSGCVWRTRLSLVQGLVIDIWVKLISVPLSRKRWFNSCIADMSFGPLSTTNHIKELEARMNRLSIS